MGTSQDIQEFIKEIFSILFGEFSWIFLVGLIVYGFKNVITEIVEGILFYYNDSFRVDDIVYLTGSRKARITKIGFLKTTMYIYNEEDKAYRTLVVPNTKLTGMMLEKPLTDTGDRRR